MGFTSYTTYIVVLVKQQRTSMDVYFHLGAHTDKFETSKCFFTTVTIARGLSRPRHEKWWLFRPRQNVFMRIMHSVTQSCAQ